MPGKLRRGLEAAGVENAATVAQQVFKSPLQFVKKYPPGTVPREAVVNAYRDVQKILTIIGVVLCAILIPVTLLIDNVHLDDRTTLVKDTDSDTSDETRHQIPIGGVDEKAGAKDLDDRDALNNAAVERRDVNRA